MRKDVRDLLRNRAMLLSLLAPVLPSALFVRVAEHRQQVRLTIAVQQSAPAALLEKMDDCAALKVLLEPSAGAVRGRVESGQADLGVELPRDLAEAIEQHEQPSIQVLARQDRGPMVAAGLSALVEIVRAYAGQVPPVQVELVAVGAAQERVEHARLLSSWMLFAMLVGFTVVAASLIEEREKGTLQAILVTSTPIDAVLIAKAITGWGATVLSGGLILLVQGLAGHPVPPASGLVLVSGSACVVSVGLWLATLMRSLAEANTGLSLGFMALFVPVFLVDLDGSGRYVPWVSWMPGWEVQHGLQQSLLGTHLPVAAEIGGLLLWTVVFGCAARWGARRL